MSTVAPPTPPDPPAHSPTPRRIATPRWLDLRLVVGVVLVLASVAIGARIVSAAGATSGVVAADHDLAAGKVLSAGDLHMAQVRLPDRGKDVYLAHMRDAIGRQLQRDVSTGELLAVDAITAALPRTTLTVPLASGAAPALTTGERIEVWMSTPTCPSTVLLPDVTIQKVSKDTSSSFGSGDDGQNVVISVARELADRVASALAIEHVQLRAGILRGPRPGPTSNGVETQSLPGISKCAAPGN